MKTKSFIMTDGYQSPAVAKIDIAVEQGFAASSPTPDPWGESNFGEY